MKPPEYQCLYMYVSDDFETRYNCVLERGHDGAHRPHWGGQVEVGRWFIPLEYRER